jgi:predicted nucleotidyltransferase
VQEIKNLLAPVFEKMSDRIAVAYLFGSAANGEDGPGSDIDLAVLLHDSAGNAGLEVRLDLYADCSRALKRNDIDVVVLNTARNLFLLNDVVRKGIVLYQCDSGLREEFEVKIVHDFIDFRDHRRRILGV